MKGCPHCDRKISYGELMKYSFGKGTIKYDKCSECGNDYQVTMNLLFLVILVCVVGAIILFVIDPESRLVRKVSIAGVLLLAVPLFPLFMKVSKSE
ncbi:MAG: hypothetical protein RR620_07750 [Clostridium sp.]